MKTSSSQPGNTFYLPPLFEERSVVAGAIGGPVQLLQGITWPIQQQFYCSHTDKGDKQQWLSLCYVWVWQQGGVFWSVWVSAARKG